MYDFSLSKHAFFWAFQKSIREYEVKQIAAMYPDDDPRYSNVQHWYANFGNEEYCLDDEARPERPYELGLEKLRAPVEEEPFQSIRFMAVEIGIPTSTVCIGLHKLGLVKKLDSCIIHQWSTFDLNGRIDACST
jgi:hypothetical protein